MKGSLQLKRGIWQAVICYQDEAGKKKYKWISTELAERGNKKAAKAILDKELEKFEKELSASKEKIERRSRPKEIDRTEATMLFSDYVVKYVDSIKQNLSPVVYQNYRYVFPIRIREFFDKAKLRLIDITSEEIAGFYDYLKKEGLKNVSIKHFACVLRPALRQAYKAKLIPDNPYDFVPALKKERPPVAYFDKTELGKLFNAIDNSKIDFAFKVAYKMAAYYGLRRSELLGLRWKAIDFEHETICINHKVLVVNKNVYLSDTLKTKTSNRTLPLFADVVADLNKLRGIIEDNKQFYRGTYNQKYLDYVFVKADGRIIYPDHLTKTYVTLLKDNNLKAIRLHDLRHSCASLMLANGVSMKEIQDWLGHADFATTANIYSHLDFSSKKQSASIIANAINSVTKPPEQNANNAIQAKPILDNESAINMMFKEMSELGFTDYVKYLEYKNGLEIKQDHNSKNEMCM